MGTRKPVFGSTEAQARKAMDDFRKTMGMPPIDHSKKKKKSKKKADK